MRAIIAAGLVVLGAGSAQAATGTAPHLDGSQLGLVWSIPFVGILLSIALMPLLTPRFWHHHFGKVSAFWALAFIIPFALLFGVNLALFEVMHTLILEYIPFIILLFALFTVAAGVRIKGSFGGTPTSNTAILGVGTLVASWMGTTGASMLLIRPLLKANQWRKKQAHLVVFFIFLVSNIGGALTPLGDPPLFLGFLKGVDFFWTTTHLLVETLFVAIPLLAIFFVLDLWFHGREAGQAPAGGDEGFGIEGSVNLLLLGGIVGAVLLSGVWKPGISVVLYHNEIELQNVARDVLLLLIAFISLRATPKAVHDANEFSWGPIAEVAKLFAAIFLTIVPVIAMLKAGLDGPMRGLVALVTNPDGTANNAMYFWLTGALSSFLDNAPTYLVFFNMAGGDADMLMTTGAATLAAISSGAVYMGANSYIGNAPNFMVKAIAESRGVETPSFFGYMVWSVIFLVPLFAVATVLFFT